MNIEIALIRTNGGTQSRAALCQNVIDEYASAIASGAVFPPVVTFFDGQEHWLADGFHRCAAYLQLGLSEIEADVRHGTRRDAILQLKRTIEDKRHSALTLLNDPEWTLWSDREIARQCVVSHTFVANLRQTVTGNVASENRLYQTKHGTPACMNTSAIGQANPRIIPFDEHQAREHLAAVKVINAGKWEEWRASAIARTNSVEFNAEALGKFAVIYADPPWRYENPPISSPNRRTENHYPTMPLDEICAMPVVSIAHEDSVLFLWATAPKLYECMRVIDAWGFTYRTGMVWAKDKVGLGYYVRNQHEHLLICKRGEMPRPLDRSLKLRDQSTAPSLRFFTISSIVCTPEFARSSFSTAVALTGMIGRRGVIRRKAVPYDYRPHHRRALWSTSRENRKVGLRLYRGDSQSSGQG